MIARDAPVVCDYRPAGYAVDAGSEVGPPGMTYQQPKGERKDNNDNFYRQKLSYKI